jgi:thioredoxin 1
MARAFLFVLGLTLSSVWAVPAMAQVKLIPFIKTADFAERIAKAEGFVVIKSWAIWCPACNAATPMVQEFYSQHHDKLSMFILDWDEEPELISKLNVRGLPHYLLIYNGRVLHQKRTVHTADDLTAWVNYYTQRETGTPLLPTNDMLEAYDPATDDDEDTTPAPQGGEPRPHH